MKFLKELMCKSSLRVYFGAGIAFLIYGLIEGLMSMKILGIVFMLIGTEGWESK